ncbi:LRR receptor-like serine/threonine-protein kinase RPK2 [Phalaenopsis equestris]|uniref:LRR receptor-like serine/threonine-protein kinase RPK2 n=1 Tax=Phalaenopsis equestris TaxID=78828 RepID=UPI0009E51840|nr:LRR receptor-like serine/threonine-protein kinase RPK2 [Phalaenopsis equestris]XP_020586607.1 LRR receptor-like serine/threonine-protein kinase RPK2 [Phalaenopsis equestris]XP_020586609.1 LRR receptor-like serine/threonine-protein kinase RPK2 [Phalaenopsis equestris]
MGFLFILKLRPFFSVLLLFSSMVAAFDPAAGDQAALLAFKSSVTVDVSAILSGWDPAVSSHCEWHGVTCNGTSGRVTGIDLAGTKASRLGGMLNSHIGNLSNLRFLSLPYNSFSGEIPGTAIGSLRKLELLDLRGNYFSGEIPDQIGNLESLVVLDLSYNSLQGPIPNGLIGLRALKTLDLSFNRLSGSVKVSPIADCKSLNHLNLSGNLLVGVIAPEIGRCSNLQSLFFNGNVFEGSIPADLGRLTELRILDVSMNSLTGKIPKELGNCQRLSVLILTDLIGTSLTGSSSSLYLNGTEEFNAFSGAIPPEIFSIPSLEILWTPRANLDGQLPGFLKSSCGLRILNLGQNYITGAIPEWIGSCGNLTYLDLSVNNLQGSVPVALSVQCKLYFNVSRNMLSGSLSGFSGKICTESTFFDSLFGSQQEDEIDILKIYYNNLIHSAKQANPYALVLEDDSLILHDFSWNQFSGSMPYFMLPANKNFSYSLLLNNNLFNGSLSDNLWKSCTGLNAFAINLSSNQLSGEIGKLSNCLQIKIFEAANNNLGGQFPSDIGNLLSLLYIDVRRNNLSGTVTNQLGTLKKVEVILLGSNYLSGSIPVQLGELASLKLLDLSKNSLSGSIPSSLADASKLEILLLDHNYFSGNIPPSFSNLSRLAMLNLSFNNLSGEIPHLVHVTNCKLFEGNQFLKPCLSLNATPPSVLPSNNYTANSNGQNSKLKPFMVASIASTAVIFFILVLLGIFLITGIKRFVNPNLRSKVVVTFTATPSELNYSNVLKATGNFSLQNLIGTGGFGATYKAELLPDYLVAVKRLYIGKFQGLQQFDAEIRTLGRIRHKNLVTLIGYHMGERNTFLIYNYLSGGNLETFIHNMSQKDVQWAVIHKIALDVALAISYLHYSCAPRIVHRDIKPSNILLDEKHNAYLSDFGLARLLEVSQTHATTNVAGTFGYVAPEYAVTCKVSDKADVYSFGVVLLELLSGKRSLDPSFWDYGDGFNIVGWSRLLIQEERCAELFFPSLWKAGPADKLVGILRLALACTVESLSIRPSMKQVVEMLKNLKN